MIGRDDDIGAIGETKLAQRVLQPLQIVVGALDGGGRRRAVDARRQRIEAVTLSVLRAVRIPRPIEQHKWLVASPEQGKNDLGGSGDEVTLLNHVGDGGPGSLKIADLGIGCSRRGCRRQADRRRSRLEGFRQRNALRGAGGIVDDDRLLAAALRMIENQSRSHFPDDRGAEPASSGCLKYCFLVEIVAAEVLVHFAKHSVVLEKRRHAVAGA